MSENRTPSPGLSTGIKSMLIILGVMLSIIIFIIWAGIIRGGSEISSGTTFTNPTSGAEEQADDAPETDPVDQAREPIIAMVNAPACENVQNDTELLSEFVTVSGQEGGLTEDDRRLIVDTLNKIDETCSKDFSISLNGRLSSAGVAIELAQISSEADWVTKSRPAPEDARELTQFALDGRNIHCTLESNRVACSIYAYTFPSVPSSCETYTQTYVVQESTETDALCSWRLQADSLVGSGFYANETFACEVKNAATTVECWSQLSGKGFEVNRATGRTF